MSRAGVEFAYVDRSHPGISWCENQEGCESVRFGVGLVRLSLSNTQSQMFCVLKFLNAAKFVSWAKAREMLSTARVLHARS